MADLFSTRIQEVRAGNSVDPFIELGRTRVILAIYAARIEALLHGAILGASVTAPLRAGAADGLLDLSGLDFDRLGELFAGRPHAAAEAVRGAAEARACAMAAANPTRLAGWKSSWPLTMP